MAKESEAILAFALSSRHRDSQGFSQGDMSGWFHYDPAIGPVAGPPVDVEQAQRLWQLDSVPDNIPFVR